MNHLEGPLPPSLSSLARLEELTGYRNHINGPLPPDIGVSEKERERERERESVCVCAPGIRFDFDCFLSLCCD
jgi:hypothetical protein